jgi:hypothetical protein
MVGEVHGWISISIEFRKLVFSYSCKFSSLMKCFHHRDVVTILKECNEKFFIATILM